MSDLNTTNKPKKKKSNPLIGAATQATTLDSITNIDIDTGSTLIDALLDAGVTGGLDMSSLERFTAVSNSRNQRYQLIDTMTADSSVSSVVRTMAADATEISDNGHVVWCESSNPQISKFVNYLLNVMNVDKHILKWADCLIKYGDVYIRLFRDSDYADDRLFKKTNIANSVNSHVLNEDLHSTENELNLDFKATKTEETPLAESVNIKVNSINDHYSHYVEMVSDPGTMFELVKYGKTMGYVETPNEKADMNFLADYQPIGGSTNTILNYRMKSSDVNVYQADDFVHASLDNNFSRYPETVSLFLDEKDFATNTSSDYTVRSGKSMLIDAYKVWRERSLLESAVLLNRVTKSSVVRTIQVEVGDMPKPQAQKALRQVKELFEQKSAINTDKSMNEYTNPGPVENNVYLATHEGKGGVTVASVGGDIDVKGLADLDAWDSKFYGAFGIPKQFFGLTSDGAGFNGGTSLSITSSEYAKLVRLIQNSLLQAITDAINLFLLDKGCKSFLNNFVLKMKQPATQEEIDYRAALSNRIQALSSLQGLFTDVEDRAQRLRIVKELVSTLNYGDELITILQEEITAAEQQAEEARLEAEAEKEAEEAANKENDFDFKPPKKEDKKEKVNDLDLELPAIESIENTDEKEPLLEKTMELVLTEDEDNLPTPEALAADIDFTKNN